MNDSSDENPIQKRSRLDSDKTDSHGSSDGSSRISSERKRKCLEHKKKKKDKRYEKRKGKKKKRDKDREKEKKMKKKKRSKKEDSIGPELPPDLANASRNFAPMSKQQWETKRNDVRRVLDEETGRYRLIRGDGEVLEEIVSRERHYEINKQATQGDGAYFQTVLGNKKL